MRLIRLFLQIVLVSVQRELADRGNVAFQLLLALISALSGVLTVSVIFSYTGLIGGWSLPATLTLYGTFLLVSGLIGAFVEPNLNFFAGRLRSGELDDVLVQPAPSLFLATLTNCSPWSLLTSLTGLGIILWAILSSHLAITLLNLVAYVFLLACGVMIAWATRVLLATVAFWFPGLEPSIVYSALWQLGSYPITIYSRAVQVLLFSLVPVAFIAMVPAQSLTEGSSWSLVVLGGLVTVLALGVTAWVWAQGLRRYTSASS